MIFQVDPFVYVEGIAFSIIATLMFNWGPIWQKMGLGQMEEIKTGNFWVSIKRMFTNRKWLLGFAVGTGGGVFYFVALNIAGVTVVQPLLNFGYIMLAIYARRLLGETLDTRAKVGIGLLIAMPAFVAFGDVSLALPLTEFTTIFLFSIVNIIIILSCLVIAKKVKIMWAIAAGGTFGLNNLFLQWFTLDFFATLGTTGDIFRSFGAAILPFIVMMITTIIANFGISQIGLQKNPASRYNPINGTYNMIVTIIGGILIYSQVISNWASYSTGIALGVLGILLLSKYQIQMSAQKTLKSPGHAEPPSGSENEKLSSVEN